MQLVKTTPGRNVFGINTIYEGNIPVEQLQERRDEEVHSMRILVYQEGQSPKEMHDAPDHMQHVLPR